MGTSCTGLLIPVVATLARLSTWCSSVLGYQTSELATDQINRDGVLHEEWRDWTGGFDTPEAATRFMFNDCDAETLDWSLTTVRLLLPLTVYARSPHYRTGRASRRHTSSE